MRRPFLAETAGVMARVAMADAAASGLPADPDAGLVRRGAVAGAASPGLMPALGEADREARLASTLPRGLWGGA